MLTLKELQLANVERCSRWHGPRGVEDWTSLEWAGAAAGEMGEAANVAKKLKRFDTNMQQTATMSSLQSMGANHERETLVRMLASEIAGTVIYLGLLAAREGIDLESALREEFNRVSVREGFPERL